MSKLKNPNNCLFARVTVRCAPRPDLQLCTVITGWLGAVMWVIVTFRAGYMGHYQGVFWHREII